MSCEKIRRKVETTGWKQKYRLTRPLASGYVYHCGHCGQRELAHPAPSAAIELQFSTDEMKCRKSHRRGRSGSEK